MNGFSSLLAFFEINFYRFGFWVLCGGCHKWRCFAFFLTTLPGTGRQPNEPIFWLKLVLETRLSCETLEPLIGFLAYLEAKLWPPNQK